MKKYGAYLTVLGSLIVIAMFIAGAYSEFCTVDKHKEDVEEIRADQASMQKQIKEDSIQDRIWWLDGWIRDVWKQYGRDPARYPPRIRQDYDAYTEELEALKQLLQKLKGA